MSENDHPGVVTAIEVANEFVLARFEEDEIYQVLHEAMEAQMPRWAAHNNPVPALKTLLTSRWERRTEQPFPSDDAGDQFLYLLGLLDGMIRSYPLRELTTDEKRDVHSFARVMCGDSME